MIYLLQASVSVPIINHQNLISPITDLGLFVSRIVSVFLIIAALVTFLYLVMGGIKWIIASGDAGKLEEARNTITNALIGLAITASAWAIFLLVNHFFGLGIASSQVVGNQPPPGIGGPPSTIELGNPACRCGGAGGCAKTSDIGLIATGGDCYVCTNAGWRFDANAECGPITCAACP